ncbi:MAG: PQQ-binding-like beta-propeller repeat protein, partial [Lentisphaeria bacterium]
SWQQKIPLLGYNSPVIWGERIFVAGGNAKTRALFCYSLEDGSLLWQQNAGSIAKLPEVTEDTGYSAPTLAVDQNRVYGVFATGQLLCLDHQGQEIWTKNLPFPEILYGYASSLLLAGSILVVQYDLDEKQVLYGFDAVTGKEIWKTQRESSVSWSSPVLLAEKDRYTLFTGGNSKAEGFELFSGRKLWENACLGGEVASSAFAENGYFYFANSGALSGAFSAETGELFWQNENVPLPDVASPIVADGVMYLFCSGGSVIALDAANGSELYEENFASGFYASPVLLEGKIVAVNMDGLLLLIQPSAEKWIQLATYESGRKVLATPAFAKGKIILRSMTNELICLEGTDD